MSHPATIRGVGINKTGDVDVIEDLTIPFPERKPDEVLIKVQYIGVNFIDTYFRKGLYPPPSFPFFLSGEVTGTVVELPTDESVLNNEDYRKLGLKVGGKIGASAPGSQKAYISVPWSKAFPIPDNISLRTATASVVQGLTTLTLLTESYNVQKGDYVLIHTIAGGVGLLMSQIAKARGAIVIGTTSTPAKAELAKAHGADHVILYKDEDTVKRVAEITNGQGPQVIYDGVGKDTFDDDLKIIRRKGTLVSFGNASGAVPPVPLFKLTEKNIKLLRPTVANYIATPEERAHYSTQLWKLISSGELKINIHGEYPFSAEGVRQAHLDLTGGKTTGKLLIKVAGDAEA